MIGGVSLDWTPYNLITLTQRRNEMTNDLRIALCNVRRYGKFGVAARVARRQIHWTPVLLGDDGKFWVPATNHEAGLLINAGYQQA